VVRVADGAQQATDDGYESPDGRSTVATAIK
jgi:hypothetical protein